MVVVNMAHFPPYCSGAPHIALFFFLPSKGCASGSSLSNFPLCLETFSSQEEELI